MSGATGCNVSCFQNTGQKQHWYCQSQHKRVAAADDVLLNQEESSLYCFLHVTSYWLPSGENVALIYATCLHNLKCIFIFFLLTFSGEIYVPVIEILKQSNVMHKSVLNQILVVCCWNKTASWFTGNGIFWSQMVTSNKNKNMMSIAINSGSERVLAWLLTAWQYRWAWLYLDTRGHRCVYIMLKSKSGEQSKSSNNVVWSIDTLC